MLSKYVTISDYSSGERSERKLFSDVLVHIDFKGAPPTFSYLKSFIDYIGKRYANFVTGLVFEFEDTFPYEGFLT